VTFMFAWSIPIARSLNSCESRGILLSLQVNSGELSICHRFVNKVVSLSMAVKVARSTSIRTLKSNVSCRWQIHSSPSLTWSVPASNVIDQCCSGSTCQCASWTQQSAYLSFCLR
jgi:hypothetical protein